MSVFNGPVLRHMKEQKRTREILARFCYVSHFVLTVTVAAEAVSCSFT